VVRKVGEVGMTKQDILDYFSLIDFAYNESGRLESLSRMLDELLKEQEEQKQKWLQNIADNQLAFAPSERDNAYCYIKHQGIYDGLQMAYDILTEGR